MAAVEFRSVARPVWTVLVALVCWLGLGAQRADAQPYGYSISTVGTPDEFQLYQVDLTNGDATWVGPLGFEPSAGIAAAASPDGEVFLIDGDGDLATIDLQTGQASLVADLTIARISGLAFAPDGDLRIVAESEMYRVSPQTGLILDTIALAEDVRTLAANRYQMVALWVEQVSGDRQIAEIDPDTGELGEPTTFPTLDPCLRDAELDSRGDLWLLTSTCSLLLFTSLVRVADLTSGTFESVASWGVGGVQVSFPAFVIPEQPAVVDIPALSYSGLAWLVLALALAGGWVLARRRS